MNLQTLLVTKDDDAAEVLSRVLASFAVSVERFSEVEIALQRLGEQRFDGLVVDFAEPETARQLLQAAYLSKPGAMITMALVNDEAAIREISAMLRRERRRSFRVPVQAPVQITVSSGEPLEGIMLDLSQTGMDVLAAQPLLPAAVIHLDFALPDGSAEIDAHAEVAWANPNGQSGVRFLDLSEAQIEPLKNWLLANSPDVPLEEAEPVSVCKLTDLSLGGCYVETESPFPERSGIVLCLKAAGMEVQAEGLVRVMHPEFGMGIEFASGTAEQREQVGNFIGFLTSRPGTVPQLLITPKALAAGNADDYPSSKASVEPEDLLLDLLNRADSLSQEEFLQELRQQRNSEEVASS